MCSVAASQCKSSISYLSRIESAQVTRISSGTTSAPSAAVSVIDPAVTFAGQVLSLEVARDDKVPSRLFAGPP